MNLSAPMKPVFLVSLVLFIISVIIFFVPTLIPSITVHIMWIVIIGWGILIAGNLIKGL